MNRAMAIEAAPMATLRRVTVMVVTQSRVTGIAVKGLNQPWKYSTSVMQKGKSIDKSMRR
jgi:hypothetical protein